MTLEPRLYAACFGVAAAISFFLTPLVRLLSLRMGLLDAPSSAVKTHTTPTPIFGGVAIWAGFAGAMMLLRFTTNFPNGTLYNLRALLVGGTLIFLLGLADDLRRPQGIGYRPKFVVQFLATALLVVFGLRIHFINPTWFAIAVTLVWVVGVTNSMNIIDIMDGLAASQAAVAAVAFLFVSLPSQEHYVRFAAAAVAGAAIGFLPWNFSKKYKVFMGDCGSLTLGFLLAGLSLGAHYSSVNNVGVFAPLLILFVPVFDTFFVSIMRVNQGKSPFLGSKDHFALRLETLGYTRGQIVVIAAVCCVILSFAAFLATQYPVKQALAVYALVAAALVWVGLRLSLVRVK
jgi:UDP-GlcNAc:undecaprenyl-phosphate GlcNAc-1-phosphate transferase